MFSPDDLRQIKDNIADPPAENRPYTSRTRLATVLSVSLVCVFIFIYLVVSLNLLVAGVGIGQVGGFFAEIEEVSGDDVTLYPVATESANCPDTRETDATGTPLSPDPEGEEDVLPAMRVEVGGAQVDQYDDIEFVKDIETPEIAPVAGVRLRITRPTGLGNDINLGDAAIDFTSIEAEEIDLQTDLEIEEMYDEDHTFGDPTSFSPGGVFRFEGEDATITNAEAVAHFVSFSELSIPDLELEIEYIENEWELEVPETTCPIVGPSVQTFITDTNEPVDTGDTLTVDVDVQNPGEEYTSSWVYLDFDEDEAVDQEFVGLDGSEGDSIELSYDVPSTQPEGEYEVEVRSDDSSDSRTVLVGDPPEFSVGINDTNAPVDRGEQFELTADVTNVGSIEGTQDVTLEINGTPEDGQSLTVDTGDTTTETFVWETDDDDELGTYEATVLSDDDSESQTFELVIQDDFFEVDITDYDSSVNEGETASVTFDVENIGSSSGTQDVSLDVLEDDGETPVEEEADSVQLSLDPGQSSTNEVLEWDTSDDDGGETYAIQVTSENDDDLRAVQVIGDVDEFQIAVVGNDEDHRGEIVTAVENHLDPDSYSVSGVFPPTILDDPADAADTYDALVVNTFADGDGSDITSLYNLADTETGIISLENWGGSSDAITRRHEETGDPDEPQDSFSGDSPVQMDITSSHPIFEDPNFVGTSGATVDVYDAGGSADRAWFPGFTDGDVIAEVDSSDSDGGGPGVGVTDDEHEVLLSLGFQTYIDSYETAGEQIIANSVYFVTEEDVDAEILNFDVPLDPGPYETGETVEAQVEVENTGDGLQTFFVDFRVEGSDGIVRDNDETTGDTVTLNPGVSDTVTVGWEVEDDTYDDGQAPAGDYDAYTDVWEEASRPLQTSLDSATVANAFEVVVDVALPLRTEEEFQDLGATFNDESDGNIQYEVDTTTSSVDGASARFETEGNSGEGYGEVVVLDEDFTDEDWLSFEYLGDSLSASFGNAEVYVGNDLVWESSDDVASWQPVSIDVSDYTGEQDISFRLATPSGTGNDGRSVNYDDIQFTDTSQVSLPLSTEQEFTNLGETFSASTDNIAYEVDTTMSIEDGASARFETQGTGNEGYGEVTAGADFSGEDWLTFEHNGDTLSSSFATAEIYIGDDLVWSTDDDTDGWETVSIDVSGYTTEEDVTFRFDTPSGTNQDDRNINFDHIRFTEEARELMAPFRTEQDFQDLGDEFEDTGDPDTDYGVDTDDFEVEDGSGYLETLGTGGNGYGQVSWEEDLTNYDTLSFLAQGGRSSNLDDSYAAAQVLVDGNLVWERTSNFAWERQNIDISGYTGETEIAFRLDARGTGVTGRGWNFDDIQLEEGAIDASITNVDWDAFDTYEPGEGSYGADVTIENTGGVEHEFFVGFSGIDPSGNERDNSGTTGTFTQTLPSGQQDTVRVDLNIEDDFETGTYDAVTAVWTNEPDLIDGEQIESLTNTDAFEVEIDVSLPLRTEEDWQAMGDTFNDVSNGNIDYQVDTTQSSIDTASGQFVTAGNNEEGYGEVVVEEDMTGEDWLAFDYESDDLTGDFRRAEVYVGGQEVFSTNEDTTGFETRYIDISGFTGTQEISLRMATPSGTGVTGQELNYDDVRFVDESEVFNAFLPEPDISYVVEGTEYTSPAPAGFAHDGDWFHDNTPIEEGETRTYVLYAPVPDGDIDIYLRDGVDTDPSGGTTAIDNEIHNFADRYDTDNGISQEMVRITVDYTDSTQIEKRLRTTGDTGGGNTLTQTYDASGDNEVYFSTYEFAGATGADSLRILPELTSPFSPEGGYWSQDVSAVGSDGFDHDGDWVDDNAPIQQGEIRRYVYDEAGSDADLRGGLRDEPISDPGRGASDMGAGELVLWDDVQGSGLYEPGAGEVFDVVVDYSNPSEIEVRVNTDDVVETYDASDDNEVYWSVYEWSGGTDESSLRLLSEEVETTD